jgi:triosephosphate isomerase (TIM)
MRNKKIIIANWKMNGNRAAVVTFMSQLREINHIGLNIAVCLPFPYLETAQQILINSKITLGAQDVSAQKNGAYTGDVSADMLKEFGCQFVLVGHSERRHAYKETDDFVLAKTRQALMASLNPVICVGESVAERESQMTEAVVLSQVEAVLKPLTKSEREKCVIAYEPLWAIGSGLSATPTQAQQVHASIRSRLDEIDSGLSRLIPIIYGGSLKPESADGLFEQQDIDGGLVGSASLKFDDFVAIIRSTSKSKANL